MDLQYIMSRNAEEETRHEKRKFYIPGTNKPRDGTESQCCHSPPREGKRFRIAGQVGQKIARDNPPASLTPDLGYLRFDEPPLLESSKPLLFVPPAPALGPTTTFQATTPRNNAHFNEDGKAKDDGKGVLLGYWKDSPEESIADKHAIRGLIWRNGTFRFKVVPYTRDGNPVKGKSPLGLEAYHVNYDNCVFGPKLNGLKRTEIEEYCRARTEGNDVDQAIEKAKERVAKNALDEVLNGDEFDEKNRIRLEYQARIQKMRSLGGTAKNKMDTRFGRKEAKHTATVNSTRGPETVETMCQNVDDMPNIPARRRIFGKRPHASRTKLLEPSESDRDILTQTSEFEPDEESDGDMSDYESSKESDEDISVSKTANAHQAVGSRQKPRQNADPLSANNIMVESVGHRQRHFKRTSPSGDHRGSSIGARSELLPVPQKDMPQTLIVKLPLPSLSYSKGSLKYQKATPAGRVEEAIRLVLKDFTYDLSDEEKVAAINVVRQTDDADVFLLLKDDRNLRRSWLWSEVRKCTSSVST
ncbi:hypothetical protein V496_01697 [Pseudogymnoascus sp. VKM F-4515 (FW-2607)]|nr:hypothetical protein V496_01697 [Pseudogymnoascus sp. VKM F-4515 (FW-2607)]